MAAVYHLVVTLTPAAGGLRIVGAPERAQYVRATETIREFAERRTSDAMAAGYVSLTGFDDGAPYCIPMAHVLTISARDGGSGWGPELS